METCPFVISNLNSQMQEFTADIFDINYTAHFLWGELFLEDNVSVKYEHRVAVDLWCYMQVHLR